VAERARARTRGDETSRRILRSAAAEFARWGFSGARVHDIAKRAGVSKERLYHYHGEKVALFHAVVRDAVARIGAAEPFVADRLGAYTKAMLEFHASERQQLVAVLLAEGQSPSDLGLEDQEERREHYARRVASLRAAQAAGSIRDDVDPRTILYAVLALVVTVQALPQLTDLILDSDPDRRLPLNETAFRDDLARLVDGLTRP
jgi:AcrR family transcriptional regulator